MLMEKNLLVLGTLGNNAPFIGLFGTVLGIIKAFNDLAIAGTSGPTVVMRGVSEALVATAVGLLIAIPAVAAYNYFQSRIKKSLASADRLSRLLLAYSGKKKRAVARTPIRMRPSRRSTRIRSSANRFSRNSSATISG